MTTMAALAAGKKLFHPRHLWLRAISSKETTVFPSSTINGSSCSQINNKPGLLVDVGITRRGLEDIGDVSSITNLLGIQHSTSQKQQWPVSAGDGIVEIDWDAHKITSADELYHTVWETISESTVIQAPVAGVVEHVERIYPSYEEIDEDTVLCRIQTDDDTLKKAQAMGELLEEDDYSKYIQECCSPGKFQESTV